MTRAEWMFVIVWIINLVVSVLYYCGELCSMFQRDNSKIRMRQNIFMITDEPT